MHWIDRVGELKERVCAQEGVVRDSVALVYEGYDDYHDDFDDNYHDFELKDDTRWFETSVLRETYSIVYLYKR